MIMFSFEKDSKENLGNELTTESDTYYDQRNMMHEIERK